MSDVELFEDEAAISEFKSLMADPASRQAFVELKAQAAESGARRRYAHVLRAVSETPWAIEPRYIGVIVDILANRVNGVHFTAEEIEARIGAGRRTTAGPQGVAVIPLHGVIMPRASMMTEVSGGTSIDSFRQSFRQAVAATDIGGIVLDVDSPGGMVDGVPELAQEIRGARGAKPIVAVANTEAASAAYWLASQADQVVVTKSGRVGSIGVYTAHEDESARGEMDGVKTTLVSAGKYKTEGNPFEPLSDEARANLQSMVDDYYGMFVSDVARGRRVGVGDVRTGFGEGRIVQATGALATGMVDRIATLDEVIADVLVGVQRKAAAAALETLPTFATTGTNNTTTDSSIWSISFEPEEHGPEFDAAVDNSAWDGNRAMTECNSASDYNSICAGKRAGDPAERQSHALPHHYLGRGPNASGVRAALARIGQTQGLINRDQAQSHLDRHMSEINPGGAVGSDEEFALDLSDLDPDGVLGLGEPVDVTETEREATAALVQRDADVIAELQRAKSGEE